MAGALPLIERVLHEGAGLGQQLRSRRLAVETGSSFANQIPPSAPATTMAPDTHRWPSSIPPQSGESAARTMQNTATTAVSGSDALVAAITGGIASSPMNTSVSELTASMTTTAAAMSIATSAGPESSFRRARSAAG